MTKNYYSTSTILSPLFTTVGSSDETLSNATRTTLPVVSPSLVGQSLDDAVVGRVLAEVLEPEKGGTLALENEGDPAEGVIEIPDGDTDASVDLDACSDDLVLVEILATDPQITCV